MKPYKNNHYSHSFKQKVVLYAEKRSNREAARKYGISKSNVSRWRKFKTELQDTMPLQQRMLLSPPQVQIPTAAESSLHSQPLSPTKLKVTRQSSKLQGFTLSPKAAETPPVMPPEEVCLRWNSHHSNMQAAFPQLLEKEQYVDCTLLAEGKTLKCHRMILSSCSSYFEEILNGITPLQHPVIILKGIPFWILKSLTDFMYVGEVNIDQNKLPELLDVAEVLKVKGLAGKSSSSNSEKQDKQETPPMKKQPPKEGNPRQQHIVKNSVQANPVVTKVEDVPINDPLELLEPKFQEDNDGAALRVRENKLMMPRKIFTKKVRKRKSSEVETPVPLFPMRRGTRSRPNVKVPKYYDYEDIVKPTVSDTQPLSPIVTIKSEPLDVDDSEVYNNSENNSLNVSSENDVSSKNSSLANISINSNKSTTKMESPSKNKNSNKEKEQPATQYKIKIKSFSSLSEPSKDKPENSVDVQKSVESVSDNVNDKPLSSVNVGDITKGCDSQQGNEEINSVTETNASSIEDEHITQDDTGTNDAASEIETKDSDVAETTNDGKLENEQPTDDVTEK